MLIALTFAAALAGQSAPPPPQERREIRILTQGGPGGVPGDGPRAFLVGPPGAGRPDMDKDNDGFVTREEFTASQNAAFDMLDANKDGRISSEEFTSGRAAAQIILGGPGGSGGLNLIGRGRMMMIPHGDADAPEGSAAPRAD